MAEREHFTNGRCITFGTGCTLVGTAFGAQIGGWSHWFTIGIAYGMGILLILLATVWIAKSYFSNEPDKQLAVMPEQNQGIVPGIPTLSSLLGQNPDVTFDAKKFFTMAYYSPITAEFEKNMRTVAQQQFPNDKEGFYARLIGVGIATFHYEQTWLLIFGSQLKAMDEMNSRGLIPIADLKNHYDNAVIAYPNTYANYSFDQWYAFMKSRMLIADYPSKMVELSWMGRDFWKWIAHTGHDISKEKY
ncbi:MAG TPA: hypothetical protein VGB94_06280 [Acidobacteriaceae bacterium]